MEKIKCVRQAELVSWLQLSSRTLMRMVKIGEFPAPVKVGRLNLWRVQDVYEWFSNAQGKSFSTGRSDDGLIDKNRKKGRPTKAVQIQRRKLGGEK